MTDLDRLIAAVEAGKARGEDFRAVWRGYAGSTSIYAQNAGAAFDGSLDAALRMHRDLFDDWVAVIHTDGGVVLSDASMDRNYSASCNDNPARAWLLAILRALKAREAA
jgi:hypothetical protein